MTRRYYGVCKRINPENPYPCHLHEKVEEFPSEHEIDEYWSRGEHSEQYQLVFVVDRSQKKNPA